MIVEASPARTRGAPSADLAAIPFWIPVVAELPVGLCMAIMSLPDVRFEHGFAFRILYGVAYLAWVCPLAWVQRSLWRHDWQWIQVGVTLLVVTYAMSVINCAFGLRFASYLGVLREFKWTMLFSGLDGCWLALIAFCAIHAVVAYYLTLGRERERLAAAQLEARNAQLLALRYQLNPHFLFNSLNAVSTLVATKRNEDANRMIVNLAQFLRATLERDDVHEHALADELVLTESYLAVEQVRLGERLRVEWRIGPDVLDAMLPYLLLQPLAENAIRHGIALRSRPGRLEIAVEQRGAQLQVRVQNDMDDTGGKAQASPGIGLANVAKRLERIYGASFSFANGVTPEGRYEAVVSIPARKAEQAEAA